MQVQFLIAPGALMQAQFLIVPGALMQAQFLIVPGALMQDVPQIPVTAFTRSRKTSQKIHCAKSDTKLSFLVMFFLPYTGIILF